MCEKMDGYKIKRLQKGSSVYIKKIENGIENGYQLLCDAHTMPEQHWGTAALFLFYSLLSFFTIFNF